jgi:hypothetical protein
MTTYKEHAAGASDDAQTERLTLAEILEIFIAGNESPL